MCVVPIIIYETLAGIPGFAREHSKRITNVSEADFFVPRSFRVKRIPVNPGCRPRDPRRLAMEYKSTWFQAW